MAARTGATRVAIAGAGWAGHLHTLAAAAAGDVNIPMVAASTVGSAEELAATIGARPVTPDRLPGSANAVVIATPPASHADLAVRLLSDGTPVLVEVPLASTLAGADAIIAAADAAGVSACYAENLLFSPAVDLAVARRADLGALDHLEVRMVQPAPTWGHHADGSAVGGVLTELGPHAIALALVLVGEGTAVGVRARLASSRDDGVDDAARVEIRFDSQVIVPIDVVWGTDVTAWSAQAASERGVVRLELQPEVVVECDGEPVTVPAGPTVTAPDGSQLDPRIDALGYRAQLAGFASIVAGRGGRACPVGFGRSVLEIICAACSSAAADGEEVALPFTGPRDATPMQLWRGR